MSSVKFFSGTASKILATAIASHYGSRLGKCEKQVFKDGEIGFYFSESVRGSDVFLIQSTIPPAENIWELLLMIDAARRASAQYVTVVIPYFGYARQDRKDKPRVAIASKLLANVLTSAGADRIMTCDLHAGQIQGFFDIPVDHLNGSSIFFPYLQGLNLENMIISSPDVGGVKRARAYSKLFGVDMVICNKHREKANEIVSMQVIGDVKGKDVILVDDLIDTAGTICLAAKEIMENGANSVRAIATHGVLSDDAYEKIESSPLEEIIITDTLMSAKKSSKIKILTVAPLFANAIRKIHDHESISSLYI